MFERSGRIVLFPLMIVFVASVSFAKPVPPKELTEIFQEFSELEGKFESDGWDEAIKSIKEVSDKFELMAGEIKSNVGEKIIDDFNFVLKNLRRSILKKDLEKTEKNYIVLQKLFFDIMDTYEYKVHPLMSVIGKYIDEAAEAAEKQDFADVVNEMNEIESFYNKARNLLAEKGASPDSLEQFLVKINEVREAGELKDVEKTGDRIKELKTLFDSLMMNYK